MGRSIKAGENWPTGCNVSAVVYPKSHRECSILLMYHVGLRNLWDGTQWIEGIEEFVNEGV